jgi:hypothetical protein
LTLDNINGMISAVLEHNGMISRGDHQSCRSGDRPAAGPGGSEGGVLEATVSMLTGPQIR